MSRARSPHPRRALAALLFLPMVSLGGCNSDDSGPSEPPVTIAKSSKSGDGQTGVVGVTLDNPLEVVITRDGEPVQSVTVEWTAGNDGTMTPESSESDEDGIARAAWILGPEPGPQTASARVTDAIGSPVSFTAEAEEPTPPSGRTVQVLNNEFSPKDVTIVVGQAVTWNWGEGTVAHNVSPDDGAFPLRSGEPVPGPNTYSFVFNIPGVYRYFCDAHGQKGGIGMSGTVTVLAVAP